MTEKEHFMFTVTDNAASQLKEVIKGQELAEVGVRVFVQHQCGCGAINYGMGLDASLGDEDEVLEHRGVKFVVNSQTLSALEGAIVDYQDTPMSRGFSISNPNVQGCSCGGGHH